MSKSYEQAYAESINNPEAFWREQAALIDWQRAPQTICDYSKPPFAHWFADGVTNLCHNAIDRHAAKRPNDAALIYVSTETKTERVYSYAELQREVERMATIYLAHGVQKGDRVLIYMPMIAEAAFAMLAAVRIGAIHCVVFGGFAALSLASRIENNTPKLIVTADAGMRGGKVIPYSHLLHEAIDHSAHKPKAIVMVNRGLCEPHMGVTPTYDYAEERAKFMDVSVPCTWVESTHPSYVLYTSGTTGKPKGVQRDTGGYAVALAATMRDVYQCHAGEAYFSTSDIGWVVGHSYIIYGPLLAGAATIMYEGLPTTPDASVWWSLVEKYKVTAMFSAPTAIRVLKKHDEACLRKHDISSLRALYLAGEPLDEPTADWIGKGIGKPIIDNYWQTETGWPILSLTPGLGEIKTKLGSPGKPMYGYRVKLMDEHTGEELTAPDQKGVVAIEGPLPPGCMQTVWQDDERYLKYWQSIPGKLMYSTYDFGIKDADGYYTILGRTDDVINVAGHRLGTREIEESISSHPAVAECAVVGVADSVKGQIPLAFAVLKSDAAVDLPHMEQEIFQVITSQLGALARPRNVYIVKGLPKTRSGKLLRRAIAAVSEGRDAGDLSTLDDPSTLQAIRDLVQA